MNAYIFSGFATKSDQRTGDLFIESSGGFFLAGSDSDASLIAMMLIEKRYPREEGWENHKTSASKLTEEEVIPLYKTVMNKKE